LKIKKTHFYFLLTAVFTLLLASCPNLWMKELLDLRVISFNANGGNPVPSNQNLLREEKVIEPANPVKAGHIFFGWYTDDGTFQIPWDFNEYPTTDMTLFARWEIIPVVPVINIEVIIQPTNMTYVYGEQLDLTGLIVRVFYEDSTQVDVPFAIFTYYNITTDPDNGTILSITEHHATPITVSLSSHTADTDPLTVDKAPGADVGTFTVAGDSTTLTITVSGVTFATGQTAEYSFSISDTPGVWLTTATFLANVNTLYYVFIRSAENANYEAGTPSAPGKQIAFYTVTFDTNGGGNNPSPVTAVMGTMISQPTNPTRSGFDFSGWFDTAAPTGGNEWDFASDEVNSQIILYARWTPSNSIDITNLTLSDNTKIYGDTPTAVTVEYDTGFDTTNSGAITVYYTGTSGTTYSESTTPPVNAGTYDVSVSTAGGTEYAPLGKISLGSLTINPRQLTIIAPTGNPIKVYDGTTAYTGNGITLGAITNRVVTDDVTATITSATYNSADVATANQITIIYGITGIAAANYIAPVNGTIAGTITRALGAAVSGPPTVNGIPTENSITVNGITVNQTSVTPTSDQNVVEYAYGTTTAAPTSAWQTSTTFVSLTPNMTYYIFARSQQNANYNAGTPQVSAAIKTAAQQNTDGLTFNLIIVDSSPVLSPPASELIIYRSSANGTTTFSSINITLGAAYTTQRWYVDGDLLGTEASFTLDSSDIRYNNVGMHTLAVFITNASGTYNTTIWFEVRE